MFMARKQFTKKLLHKRESGDVVKIQEGMQECLYEETPMIIKPPKHIRSNSARPSRFKLYERQSLLIKANNDLESYIDSTGAPSSNMNKSAPYSPKNFKNIVDISSICQKEEMKHEHIPITPLEDMTFKQRHLLFFAENNSTEKVVKFL